HGVHAVWCDRVHHVHFVTCSNSDCTRHIFLANHLELLPQDFSAMMTMMMMMMVMNEFTSVTVMVMRVKTLIGGCEESVKVDSAFAKFGIITSEWGNSVQSRNFPTCLLRTNSH